jgi:hypothetical protein
MSRGLRARPSLSIPVVSKTGQTGAPEIKIGSGWIVGVDKERVEKEPAGNAFVGSLNRTRCARPVRGTLWDVAQDYVCTHGI